MLVNRNICELIEFNDIAEVNGRKVLGDLRKLATIATQRPSVSSCTSSCQQWDQNVIMGDMPQLPTSGQWRCSVLESGVTLVWFGEDLKRCFFNVVEIPKPWPTFVAFTAPEARCLFFPGSMGQDCSKAVPMFWISALDSFHTFTVVSSIRG